MKKFISLLLVLTLFANLTFAMAIDSETRIRLVVPTQMK